MSRRLAAILAADAVGFSAKMEEDEEGTLVLLKSVREVIDAEIDTYGGRMFGSAGDSVIAEFDSPVQAVRSALRIQETLADSDMLFRIGVHIGDVMVDGENLMGDGVNVAARLEQAAPPGGICISQSLADLVLDKIDADFSFAGEQDLKNISRRVGIWVWPQEAATVVSKRTRKRSAMPWSIVAVVALLAIAAYLFRPWEQQRAGSGEPTLAVMAFEDQSPGPDQGYLSDAISEGILNSLSRYTTFKTLARSSSFNFKGKNASLRDIRDQLGADLVLTGSQQKIGEDLVISVQLVDANTGDHIWSERYEGEVGQLFEFQGDIIRSVASTVGGRVSHYTLPEGTRKTVTALHLAAEGFSHFRQPGQEANARAVEFYQRAIEADPEASIGYLSMGFVHWSEAQYAGTTEAREAELSRAEDYAAKAVSLDENNYLNQYLLARLQQSRGNLQAALELYEKVMRLNPSFSNAYRASGSTKILLGDIEGAIADIEHAIKIDPLHDWSYKAEMARALWSQKRCDEALQTIRQVPEIPARTLPYLIVIQVCVGDLASARETLAKFLEEIPGRTLQFERDQYDGVWTAPGVLDRWVDSLKTAGMPEGS